MDDESAEGGADQQHQQNGNGWRVGDEQPQVVGYGERIRTDRPTFVEGQGDNPEPDKDQADWQEELHTASAVPLMVKWVGLAPAGPAGPAGPVAPLSPASAAFSWLTSPFVGPASTASMWSSR